MEGRLQSSHTRNFDLKKNKLSLTVGENTVEGGGGATACGGGGEGGFWLQCYVGLYTSPTSSIVTCSQAGES